MNTVLSNLGLVVCLLGLAIYGICSAVGKYPDAKEIGRLMFAVGLAAFLFGK